MSEGRRGWAITGWLEKASKGRPVPCILGARYTDSVDSSHSLIIALIISEMKGLKPRESGILVQGHTAGKGQGQDLNSNPKCTYLVANTQPLLPWDW